MLKVSINSLLSYFGKQSINPCIFFSNHVFFLVFPDSIIFSRFLYAIYFFDMCYFWGLCSHYYYMCFLSDNSLFGFASFFFPFCSVFAASSFLTFLLLNHFLLFRFHVKLFHPVTVFLPLICLKLLHFTFLLLYLIDNLLLES